jgi:hypothetical protein
LDDALEDVIVSSTASIESYFRGLERNIVILFVVFLVIMVAGVAVATTWGMAFLYRHFNATKSILNLIPGKSLIELSEKTDLKKI